MTFIMKHENEIYGGRYGQSKEIDQSHSMISICEDVLSTCFSVILKKKILSKKKTEKRQKRWKKNENIQYKVIQ